MRSAWSALWLATYAVSACSGAVNFSYDKGSRVWTLANEVVTARFELTSTNIFRLQAFGLAAPDAVSWTTDPNRTSTPIRFTFDKTNYGAATRWTLSSQSVTCPTDSACTQTIVLVDANKTVQLKLDLFMYSGQPVLRHSITVTNLKSTAGFITLADMVPYSFADTAGNSYRAFRVNQWAIVPRPTDFETFQTNLNPNGTAMQIQSGAHGLQCSWVALRDQTDRGLFAGWEFDGLTNASVRHYGDSRYVQLAAVVPNLHHPVAPGGTFHIPEGFIGVYQGDWDEAGYRTQRFVEAAIAKPVPDERFPYVAWDSWAYGTALDENTLKMEAWRASQLGIELFIIDLGWAKRLGDWDADPAKFPNGLKPLSDYVHSLGMKFGIHFAFAEADPNSAVLQANPDWTSTETYNYFGGLSLCLSNEPARKWVVQQALHIIDDYGADWILQDGENMVKMCTKNTHTHDPADSNYANSVQGVNAVLAEVQQLRPNVMWENCENGGNMMTFNMTRFYVTSITNDASGAIASRQAVFGATFPFPPRYADRYQPEEFTNTYITRSYMFGGPWHLMNQILTMSPDEFDLAQTEISNYKEMRAHVRDGEVFHITSPASPGVMDAIQSYGATNDTGIAIVCRDGGRLDTAHVKMNGFTPDRSYEVTFADAADVITMTGAQLSDPGIPVPLPETQDGEIVYIRPVESSIRLHTPKPARTKAVK